MGRADVDEVAQEIRLEQEHVDRVHGELVKAAARAGLVQAEGLTRGRTDRVGAPRDEELTGLFERDALVHAAVRRMASLEDQHEGLVFGRLDLDPPREGAPRPVHYVGRLGVRDDAYESLVIDWRAPAAAPFYRATPVERQGVIRRRVLRSRSGTVIGVEDDLMVPEAPDDLVVVGDGALLAALTRTRGTRMRDIVATIQQHQDEAIRAPARGVTLITGGPGTGKTVVALHRAAYLLYSDRRRFEAGGVLVVGPSAAYTAYIERVLPSLGEESVTLRSVGDVVDGVSAERTDPPETAALKGGLAMRRVLARLARAADPQAPTGLRTTVGGQPVRLEGADLDVVRERVLRGTRRNTARAAALQALVDAAWRQVRGTVTLEREDFVEQVRDSLEVDRFLDAWWRPLDPREVLLWLADPAVAADAGAGVLSGHEVSLLSTSLAQALRTGRWSVADAALVDDLAVRLGAPRRRESEPGETLAEIDELDDGAAVRELGLTSREALPSARQQARPRDPRARLLAGDVAAAAEFAHVLVDEGQDLSPMQWAMVGRRGAWASWTVVADPAQSSWPEVAEATRTRDEVLGRGPRRTFHLDVNYRNAREVFAHAAALVTAHVPDADIPDAVRESGVDPVDVAVSAEPGTLRGEVTRHVEQLLGEVAGSVAVITPERWVSAGVLEGLPDLDPRVVVVDPLSSKGLEYDATVVLDPEEIVAESPGGVRVLYVALTRAAHREHVLRPSTGVPAGQGGVGADD